ncbi:MAG: flagellar hook capping FlgD N-terminal domain-containing protein [Candidatus Solibacter sp.]
MIAPILFNDSSTGNSSKSGSSSSSSSSSSSTGNTGTTQVTKNMFLQLLVAQIKNQDPMSPTDGVQFLTQLAQFQQLEQGMNSGQDLTAIRSDLDKLVESTTNQTTN